MSPKSILSLTLLAGTLLPLTGVQAASLTLRHGFQNGADYRVSQLYHDVGNSMTEMAMMGQAQRFETPLDHQHKSLWMAKAKRSGSAIELRMDYGQQQGGERWSDPANPTAQAPYADSRATASLDPLKGLVALKTQPEGDPILDTIFRSRLAWLPRFPKQALKVGDGFTHEYVMKSGMLTLKSEDDYTLDEISQGLAYFTLETRSIAIYDYSAMQPQAQPGMPQGMGGAMAGSMTLVYKGEGTAVFDTKEGIFIERELKSAYRTQKASTGMMKMSMQGTVRERWEMERR